MIEMASLVSQLVKSEPAMWETWIQSVGWEDILEKEMGNHSKNQDYPRGKEMQKGKMVV